MYEGELWFCDNYGIPLAEKLKGGLVFGASGYEFLDFAHENRIEWENKGRALVGEMIKALVNATEDEHQLHSVENSATKPTEMASTSTEETRAVLSLN